MIELVSKFKEVRLVLWKLQLRRADAKFFKIWYKDLWVVRGLSLSAMSEGISAKTVNKMLTAWMALMEVGIARMFFHSLRVGQDARVYKRCREGYYRFSSN